MEGKGSAAMNKGMLVWRLLALAVVLLGAGEVRADPVAWGYDWTATPPFVPDGAGRVTLSNETFHQMVGDSQVVATNLKVFSTADPTSPDVFGPAEGNYSLAIKLTDLDTGLFATLTFTGQLQGTFSASSANVTNTFTGMTTQTVTLGMHAYTVTMTSYTPPGPPEQGNLGSIGATVEVREADILRVPEPTSLGLAKLGLVLAGLVVCRWRAVRRG
jgi:hypothetical protein